MTETKRKKTEKKKGKEAQWPVRSLSSKQFNICATGVP